MEALGRMMSSELFMSVAVVAVPWMLARAFAWWRGEAERAADDRYAKAVEALEAGVEEAWERFGRAWKAAHADGKFTDDERENLRAVARDAAVEAGREAGVDVLAVLGARALGSLIRKIVERRKRGE